MAIDLYHIRIETDAVFLRSIIATAQERLDDLENKCRVCHGSGREAGDEEFKCAECGGGGGEGNPHEDCAECGESHPMHVLDVDGNCPTCADDLEAERLDQGRLVA